MVPPATRRSSAFTVPELLIAIGLLAILLLIAVPALQRTRSSSDTVLCLQRLRSYGTAVLAFAADRNGALPNLSQSRFGASDARYQSWLKDGGYMKTPLRCPLIRAEELQNASGFDYSANAALCVYYPKLSSIPLPHSQVVLATESYSHNGFSSPVHFNMTIFGVADSVSPPQAIAQEGSLRRPHYHGSRQHRALNLFFLDGHMCTFSAPGNDWRQPPARATRGQPDGLIYSTSQLSTYKNFGYLEP